MSTTRVILCVLCFSLVGYSAPNDDYLQRFQEYRYWSQNLPDEAKIGLINYIKTESPLAKKLRDKWLYKLAGAKNWQLYAKYYNGSEDTNLKCYELTALYNTGKKEAALFKSEKIWLNGNSLPKACDFIFAKLIAQENFNEELLDKRIALALDKRNVGLAKYLLKKYKTPHTQELQALNDVYRDPTKIRFLEKGHLADDFYLYGLKRMVRQNLDKAVTFYNHVNRNNILSHEQSQKAAAHIALYKAIRNHDDANLWFNKLEAKTYNDVLIDWQIRYAIKRHLWQNVLELIAKLDKPNDPSLEYWQGRALIELGDKEKGQNVLKELSNKRNYYGFLASLQTNEPFNFEHEQHETNPEVLDLYSPILNEIKTLVIEKKYLEASRLVNDFSLGLSTNEQSALAHWLANDLKWYGKSVYISNNELLYDQINLRFPLGYPKAVSKNAAHYSLPPELIYAIIRQESAFRTNVISSAGAYGLMQVLPKTAQQISRKKKLKYHNKQSLFKASENIKIGSAYLSYLKEKFNNHPILMAAAYNAGPRQVEYWLKNHPPKEVDIWIETLPWHETRNYLKNVLAFYVVYQHRMGKKVNIKQFLQTL